MTILDDFIRATPRSASLSERASQVMPGGDTRAIAHHHSFAITGWKSWWGLGTTGQGQEDHDVFVEHVPQPVTELDEHGVPLG